MKHILVINPNSSQKVTDLIDAALDVLRTNRAFEIKCHTLVEGPPGIETQGDVEMVVLPLAGQIAATPADAYVIACFSDPGIHLAREKVKKPVLGIAESAMLTAIGIGRRFGIVAILDRSISRHLRYVRQLGLEAWLAGDRAINLGVSELTDSTRTIRRISEVGKRLRDEDGADVIILGCAGMGQYRPDIEESLGVPVIDPTQAAVARAQSLIDLGYRISV